ncbi:Na+/H+ antiporter NhaC family protein [Desulfosporosinus sp. Sb-LF]|uniref:Na+/H+ antiporter NhaC family protein n=1 Tax=Desulfosporosinus sp. Sb-LF TaxID=2560027 RepID=UPI00107F24E1|nr:Na+/H+ antiporter NhaC family protein [Desulfosporosinus sp. Sb-LF]TGE32081.1 Na+/H+ antiporter NhaC family protein [Desulfosporosinus sp. Sb-LF]
MKQGNSYIIISVIIAFVLLIFCTLHGIFIGFPLVLCLLNFAFIAWLRGYPMKDIIRMSYQGGKKSFIVLRILVLVGAITSLWMASGTTPAILYYGIKLIDPKLFIMYAFLISCLVSFLLGTSFGTVSTVGLSLILMAKSGNIDADIAAGAIIAGAYFGDRCSPMSSSANLVAHLTETDLYPNIKAMLTTGTVSFIMSIFLYLLLSLHHPLTFTESTMTYEISNIFGLHWVALLPALAILILAILRVDVKISMLVSILLASIISFSRQHYNVLEILRIVLLGFNLDIDSSLRTILKGGGIFSMWKVSVVVFVSCCWAGLFAETNILEDLDEILLRAKSRPATFLTTTTVSILTALLGCSQTIAIVLTNSLMNKVYVKNKFDHYQLAVDLENTCVPLAALIPWNTAAFVPSSTMNVSLTGFIPYAFFLYLLPFTQILYVKFWAQGQKKRLHSP